MKIVCLLVCLFVLFLFAAMGCVPIKDLKQPDQIEEWIILKLPKDFNCVARASLLAAQVNSHTEETGWRCYPRTIEDHRFAVCCDNHNCEEFLK